MAGRPLSKKEEIVKNRTRSAIYDRRLVIIKTKQCAMCCTKWSKADKWVTINTRHLAITSHLQLWSFLPSTFVGPRSIILQVVLSLSYQESLNFPGLTINGDKLHTPKTSAILILFPIPNSGNGCNTGCLFGYPKSFSDLL